MIKTEDWEGVPDLELEPDVVLTRPIRRARHGSFYIPEGCGSKMDFLLVCGPVPRGTYVDSNPLSPGDVLVTVSFPGTAVVLGDVGYLLIGAGASTKAKFKRGSDSWSAIMENYTVMAPEGAS